MGKFVNRSLSYIIQIIAYCLILAKSDDIMMWAMEKHSGIFAWQSSYWIDLILAVYVLLVLYALWHLLMQEYYVNFSFWLFISFISLFWRKVCHDSPSYDFTPLKCCASLSWADVLIWGLWFILAFYIVKWVETFFCNKFVSHKKKSRKKEEAKELLSDNPIKNKDEDQLDYQRWAEVVSKEIRNLKKEKAYSYGIVGEWGIGKSSFINLLREELQKSGDEIEILDFNPRNSSNSGHIQEDFLVTLCNALKKYDMGLSLLASRYIKSLRLDSRINIVASFLNLFPSSNEQELRERIGESIMRINHTIVVFIDDLDRMGREEIIEVFKLISCNASFPNTVFVTAYDKRQINRILSSHLEKDVTSENEREESVLYSDKYFQRELRLVISPERIYSLFHKMVLQDIVLSQCLREQELQNLRNDISGHYNDVRSLKQLVNNLTTIASERWNEVEHLPFVKLQIIRHRYHDDYLALMNKTILVPYTSHELCKLCCNQKGYNTVNKKSKEIIDNIFPCKDDAKYNDITMSCSFNNYFVELTQTFFKWSELEPLFEPQQKPLAEVESVISRFIEELVHEEKLRAITLYQLKKDRDKLRHNLSLKDEAIISAYQRDVQILFCCYSTCKKSQPLKELYEKFLDDEFRHIDEDPLVEYTFRALADYPGSINMEAKEYLSNKGLTRYMSIN